MLPVLFEDDLILAINKPNGIPSESQDKASQVTAEAQALAEHPDASLQLLHRLDTGTSGVLLFSKGESVFNEMRNLFKLKQVRKRYLAWTENTPDALLCAKALHYPHSFSWDLAHHPKSKKRMIVLPPGKERSFRGKPFPALTILHGFRETEFEGQAALCFEVEIVTGVMHQIRVHLKTMGFPLLGDTLYGAGSEPSDIKTRLALHAHRVQFELRNFTYKIEAPFSVF